MFLLENGCHPKENCQSPAIVSRRMEAQHLPSCPWGRAGGSGGREFSLLALLGLQAVIWQVAELLFLLKGLHNTPSKHVLVRRKNGWGGWCRGLELWLGTGFACSASDLGLTYLQENVIAVISNPHPLQLQTYHITACSFFSQIEYVAGVCPSRDPVQLMGDSPTALSRSLSTESSLQDP